MTNLEEKRTMEDETKKIVLWGYSFFSLLELYLILDDTTKFDVELDIETSRKHAFPIKLNFPFHFPTGREEKVKEMQIVMNSLEITKAKITVFPIKDFVIEFSLLETTIPITILNLMLKTIFEKVVKNSSFFNDTQHNITIASIHFRAKYEKEYALSFSSNFPNNPLVIFDEHLDEKEFKDAKEFEILKNCNLFQNHENIILIDITLTCLNGTKTYRLEFKN